MALRIIAVASIFFILAHLALVADAFESITLESTHLAELGLPLLFVSFLNLIVWSYAAPSRFARIATHFANGLLLIGSVVIMRMYPALPAFLVVGCAAAVAIIAFLFEANLKTGSGV